MSREGRQGQGGCSAPGCLSGVPGFRCCAFDYYSFAPACCCLVLGVLLECLRFLNPSFFWGRFLITKNISKTRSNECCRNSSRFVFCCRAQLKNEILDSKLTCPLKLGSELPAGLQWFRAHIELKRTLATIQTRKNHTCNQCAMEAINF